MNCSGICYIFGAADYFEPPPPPGPNDFVIAADGGYAYVCANGLSANLIVGDFDSLAAPPSPGSGVITLPQEKDDTDMVAALDAGKAQGYDTFYIYGGTGGRLDHTLANIACIADLAQAGMRGFLFDRDSIITAIKDDCIAFPETAQGIISVFSYSDTSKGVNETGLKYALSNATLHNTYPLGISNEFTGAPASLSVERGTLIVFYPIGVREVNA